MGVFGDLAYIAVHESVTLCRLNFDLLTVIVANTEGDAIGARSTASRVDRSCPVRVRANVVTSSGYSGVARGVTAIAINTPDLGPATRCSGDATSTCAKMT